MAKFRAGKNSRASVGGTNCTLEEWSTTYDGIDIITTNFEDNGYETGIIGPLSLSWTLNGKWDAAQNKNDDPPGLFPRDTGGTTNGPINLFTNVTDNKMWNMPLWRVIHSTYTSRSTGSVDFNSSGKSNGPFSFSVGSN